MINFNTMKLMASIFTPEFSTGNRLAIINIFQKVSNNLFNGEMFSLPMAQNAPPEIPRIIMSSKNATWKLEISLQRTNLIFQKPINVDIKPPTENEFKMISKDIFSNYKKETDIRIQRLALITERYSKLKNGQPVEFLVNKYCKPEIARKIFKNNSGFEIHSLKKYDLENFSVNSWIRLKTVKLSDAEMSHVLLLETDMNTYSIDESPNNNFDNKDIEKYFDVTTKELNKILKLVFIDE